MKSKLKGIYSVRSKSFEDVYGPAERARIRNLIDISEINYPGSELANADGKILGEIEIILGGWSLTKLTPEFLSKVPNLKAVLYGAGSIKYFVTDEFWAKDIPVTSAYAANAVPVAEFTLAQIILALKNALPAAFAMKQARKKVPTPVPPGCLGSSVGLISLGMVGRLVREKLKVLDLNVLAYDPFLKAETARELNVTMASIDEIFQTCDVVSLHAPWLKETENLIRGRHFEMMKPGSTFINTARGAIVAEREMVEVLKRRPEIFAMLDVTWPEPPVDGDPIYDLPNVLYTPHIAGSSGNECRRMGQLVISELERFINNQPLQWRISKEKAALLG